MEKSKFSDVLSQLQKIQHDNAVSLYVPSIKSQAKFKKLTVNQQKQIVKLMVNSALSTVSINTVLCEIVKSNNIDNVPLLTTDKTAILIQLRAHSISKEYELDQFTLNLDDVTSRYTDIPHIDTDPKEIKDGNITITVKIPTIDHDIKFGRFLNRLVSENYSQMTPDDVSNMLGDMFVYELLKFIKDVSIDDNKISFEDISLHQKLQVVDVLPSSISKKIVDYIDNSKDFESEHTRSQDGFFELTPEFFTK